MRAVLKRKPKYVLQERWKLIKIQKRQAADGKGLTCQNKEKTDGETLYWSECLPAGRVRWESYWQKTMNKGFTDTDLLIQQAEGKTLQEIINENGNDYFHRVEERELLAFDEENCVVATGGGAIYFDRAMEKFKEKRRDRLFAGIARYGAYASF